MKASMIFLLAATAFFCLGAAGTDTVGSVPVVYLGLACFAFAFVVDAIVAALK